MEKPVVFTSEGEQIVGMLHRPDGPARRIPGVILCHGFTGMKSESHFIFTKLARRLATRAAVLRFDFRGSGDSGGTFEKMSLATEIADGRAALAFLRRQPGIARDRLGVLGLSMGAVAAAHLAGTGAFAAVCLWSPLAHPELLGKKFLPRRLKRKILAEGRVYLPGGGHYIGRGLIDGLTAARPLEAIRGFRGQALIVHAKNDATLPLDHAFAYFSALHGAAAGCQLLVLADGNHTFTTEEAEERVLAETSRFFEETLAAKTGSTSDA